MKKFMRKFNKVIFILFVIIVILAIRKGNTKLSYLLDNVEITQKTNDAIEHIVENIFGYEVSYKQSENEKLQAVYLVRVVDGDTVVVLLDDEECTVRMIGVDTPESVHVDEEKNNVYGDKASTYTKEYLSNYQVVYLQYDKEMYDQYGRILAYVWLSDKVDVTNNDDIQKYMYNAILLQDGYAINKEFPPNILYKNIFQSICNMAQSLQSGLWAEEEYRNMVYQ